jgi:hypothetical protein
MGLRPLKGLLLSGLLLSGLAGGAVASDGVPSSGKLTDKDFYRLATCGAAPGDSCQGPVVRWRKAVVTVALRPAEPGYPPKLAARVDAALDRAIERINAAGSGLTLRRDDRKREADILVIRPDLVEGDPTRNIPRMPDGELIGVGFMWLWWDGNKNATEASLLISADISAGDLPSVILEELFQCLGFLYDIENPAYEGVSILAQDSNSTLDIIGQDRAILRMHYPVK